MKLLFDQKYRFAETFDSKTGFYLRTGIINDKGEDTGIDPFMRSFPNLIDVGIMGHCKHGASGLCVKSGTQCYQNGLEISKENMSIENFQKIVKQASDGRVFQIALGGRGDANKHEDFEKILSSCRNNGIVPNYTTSGLGLTKKEIEISKEHCGAIAISEYRSSYTKDAVKRFVDAGVKTNLHYILGNNTIDNAIKKLQDNFFYKGINAIIFLLHKPIGLGQKENVLSPNDERVKTFFEIIDKMSFDFKVGFDSCSCTGLVNLTSRILNESIEPCESARFSAYIDADMNMMPCSFCNQTKSEFVNLNEFSMVDAWNGEVFNSFRNKQQLACGNCKLKANCIPCFAVKGIELCSRKELFL
jgi:radical SAM protein with 4Fe4S-binding SPASM domain